MNCCKLLLQIPHVPRNFVEDSCIVRTLNGLLCNRIVRQVWEKVLRAAWVVIIAAEAHVALLVNIDTKWIPWWDYDPYSDVKLTVHDQHRVFNVLLDNPCLLRIGIDIIAPRFHVTHVVLSVCTWWIVGGSKPIGSMKLLGCVNFRIFENLLKVLE